MSDPLEVSLVLDVGGCRSCAFFWPPAGSALPYGPYSAYDFRTNTPVTDPAGPGAPGKPWLTVLTRPPTLPAPEIMDGCRKAPIMTIGINPNMTAFSLGRMGAAWAYPSFSSDDGANEWAKLAFYYRYRSVYQERFDLSFVLEHIEEEGRIVAPRAGRVVAATRADASPSWSVQVFYEGDASPTTLTVPGKAGDLPYVLLVDVEAPFAEGDLLAGRLDVPEGIEVPIQQQSQGYFLRCYLGLRRLRGTRSAPLEHAEAALRTTKRTCASVRHGWRARRRTGIHTSWAGRARRSGPSSRSALARTPGRSSSSCKRARWCSSS